MMIDINYLGQLFTILGGVAAIIGLIAIWYQLKKNKEINDAQFVIEIFEQFRSHNQLFSKINPYEQRDKNLNKEDKNKIVSLLGFYESIYYLLEKNVISFETVNNSFGYTFFSLVHHEYVQESELVSYGEYYRTIFKLHKIWVKYRKSINQKIVGQENSLENLDNYKTFSSKT
jgi:hypothetical protein